jgi:rod shape-determining protein MreD
VVLASSSARRTEVYRFPVAALLLVPLAALILEATAPLYFHSFSMVNLPLLVVIYFALARRSILAGILAGALLGVAQDSLSRGPIGLFAISDTVIGYFTSLLSSRMEAEASLIRFLIVFVFYYLHFFCRFAVGVVLVGEAMDVSLLETLIASLVNALGGVLLFLLLDRFRKAA